MADLALAFVIGMFLSFGMMFGKWLITEKKPLTVLIKLKDDTWISRNITVKEGRELYDASKE